MIVNLLYFIEGVVDFLGGVEIAPLVELDIEFMLIAIEELHFVVVGYLLAREVQLVHFLFQGVQVDFGHFAHEGGRQDLQVGMLSEEVGQQEYLLVLCEKDVVDAGEEVGV
jgi:hypothetical protein